MSASLLLQYVVIALAVIVSAWVVAKKQFPGGVRRLRMALAIPMLREGRPAWLRTLGRKIASQVRSGAGGCGGCRKCD
ncbi:MAG: hypothetical protein IT469_02360 [Pseudomonadales bacterium]|nr:hypothetical protein [Pseudomonadales bacterium]